MKINELPNAVANFVRGFTQIPEAEGILLAGSRATNTYDSESDYDIYVYSNETIPVEARRGIFKDLFDYIEVNNQFWETEDDGYLRDGHIPVEIIYRDINFIVQNLQNKLERFQADVGYTTCIWANFIGSEILFDKNGMLRSLQNSYRIPYPPELKLNIIRKNYPLLKSQMPAYYHQIEKALKRGDIISINHRITAFLASYFDIVFALNEIPHPGEKKLLRIIKEQCRKVPECWEQNIREVLKRSGSCDPAIMPALDQLMNSLKELLVREKIINSPASDLE